MNASGTALLDKYFLGQIGVCVTLGFYYSLFSPSAYAITGSLGLGLGRLGYAAAATVVSPLAGVIVERARLKSILIGCSLGRAMLWGIVLPINHMLLRHSLFLAYVFGLLMFIDGAVISVASLVDTDEAGLDLVAREYSFSIDDNIRNKFNSKYEAIRGITSITLAPIAVGITSIVAGKGSSSIFLLTLICLAITAPQLYSAFIYSAYLPKSTSIGNHTNNLISIKQLYLEFREGLGIAWRNKRIRWRIVLYSLERSFMDAVQIILIAEFAIRIIAHGEKMRGALYTTLLISLIRISSMVASYLMHSYWHIPTDKVKYPYYRIFFLLAAAAGLSIMFIPLAAFFDQLGYGITAVLVMSLTCLMFSLFFTPVMLGFRNLMQSLLAEEGVSGRVFGIASTVIMGVSGLVTAFFAILFTTMPIILAFFVSALILSGIGLIELLGAPSLLFRTKDICPPIILSKPNVTQNYIAKSMPTRYALRWLKIIFWQNVKTIFKRCHPF